MHFLSAMLLAQIYRNVDPQYLADNPRDVKLSIQDVKFETPEKAARQRKLPFNRKGRLTFRKR